MQNNRLKRAGQIFSIVLLALLVAISVWKSGNTGVQTFGEMLLSEMKCTISKETAKQYAMQLSYILEEDTKETTMSIQILDSVEKLLPVYGYINQTTDYETQVESQFSYEEIVAKEAADEKDVTDGADGQGLPDSTGIDVGCENTVDITQNIGNSENTKEFTLSQSPQANISLDKLNDFDYLIHNFYVVDKTTTIQANQLNAQELLAKDMKLTTASDSPQILIYHTHSQEAYADSVPGDPSMTVVGVGEYLSQLLRDRYGLNVMHHTGEYDVESRDHAYAKAGPVVEQILADNPSIQVVIDLHRDGVADTTRLVTQVNGKQMASIMFFNGLSRTTATGDIAYLYNPYIQDNLALSFQMQLMAAQYYPGLARPIYLKGYRYNMHYCPKSLLVEVGAQTNTCEEAMSAMEPLADVLYRVLVSQ